MGKLAAEFGMKYPEVRLEVTTEDRQVEMIEEGYDLVIRVNPKPDASLVGRVFLHDRLVVVASPALSRPSGDAPAPAIVRASADHPSRWNTRSEAGLSAITVDPVLQCASLWMVRDAVRTGLGAGCLPISLVSQDLAAGRLVHWGDLDAPDILVWTLYPSRRLLSARVSAFLEHLRQAFPKGTPDELAAYISS